MPIIKSAKKAARQSVKRNKKNEQIKKAIKAAFPCVKVGEAVLGLEVPHAHIHLVPMQSENDLNFRNEKKSFPAEEMQATADAIFSEFQKL